MKLLHGTWKISKSIPKMSLYQLQELAARQQICCTQRMLVNKQQRINYLSSTMQQQQMPIYDYDQQNLNLFKEKIALQEAKLRKLRLLKGQIQEQRYSNSNVCSELETLKLLFKEKERELSVALNKIETLTRQLDEIKKGNLSNSYISGYKHPFEIENLRQELLFKTKIFKQNEEELVYKRNLLYKRKCDMLKVDQRINDLQSRLARKKQLNQQLAAQNIVFGNNENGQLNSNHFHQEASINANTLFSSKSLLRSSLIGHSNKVPSLPNNSNNRTSNMAVMSNVATVEPLPRFSKIDKQDPKYQTLPYNTKFGPKLKNIGFNNSEKLVVEDTLNELSGKYKNPIDCDHTVNTSAVIVNDSNINNATTNDISLIINTKNDSLEERPSPSGSSGSSDRISSSLTTYSYNNEKINFNEVNFKDLTKSHQINDENVFSHLFVTNSSMSSNLPNETAILSNELNENLNFSLQQQQQKGKPSVPVKPIANGNNNEDFQQEDSAFQNQNNIQNIYLNENQTNDEVDKVNAEQRSTVSEIVNKLNNLSCQESWEKTKRRPLFSSNEMERALQKSNEIVTNIECESDENFIENKNDSTVSSNIRLQEDVMNNNEKNSIENEISKEDSLNESSSDWKETTTTKLLFKRMKGSLKNKDNNNKATNNNNNNNKVGLGRRVSFDPLALLLDASLEGELELVKKTSNQVPNPSSSNDEGITALHNATCAGHFEIVKYLVEIGCDVNVQDSDGWTPLHCAASCNNLTMIKFLVKSGACIFATTFSDHETAAEKCEEDEEGFDGCSQYLYGIQEKLGAMNNGIVYALYDYESQNEDELSFKEGDVLKVLQKGDDREKEWWWSKLGHQEGYIPRNLIGLYARIKPKEKKTNE